MRDCARPLQNSRASQRPNTIDGRGVDDESLEQINGSLAPGNPTERAGRQREHGDGDLDDQRPVGLCREDHIGGCCL